MSIPRRQWQKELGRGHQRMGYGTHCSPMCSLAHYDFIPRCKYTENIVQSGNIEAITQQFNRDGLFQCYLLDKARHFSMIGFLVKRHHFCFGELWSNLRKYLFGIDSHCLYFNAPLKPFESLECKKLFSPSQIKLQQQQQHIMQRFCSLHIIACIESFMIMNLPLVLSQLVTVYVLTEDDFEETCFYLD